MITILQLENLIKAIYPSSKPENYSNELLMTLKTFEINTTLRIAGFISQVLHESGGLKLTEENLNYSAKGLLTVFKKYFPTEDLANQYARHPEKIANRVYANRMGNGSEQSGDGFKFKGRGLIQLTGKDNYKKCGTDIGVDLIANPSHLTTPMGACISAGWFWNERNLNLDSDRNDILTMTKKINGGINGLEERTKFYEKAKEELKKYA